MVLGTIQILRNHWPWWVGSENGPFIKARGCIPKKSVFTMFKYVPAALTYTLSPIVVRLQIISSRFLVNRHLEF